MSLGITIINNDSGIIVTNVEDEGSSLLIGDIISEVNREKVDNINLFEEMVDKFKHEVDFSGYEILDIDGVRFSNSKAWGLLRASNTSPKLVLRFEGNTLQDLDQIKNVFKKAISKVDNTIKTNF